MVMEPVTEPDIGIDFVDWDTYRIPRTSKGNWFEKPLFDMFSTEGKIQFDAQKIVTCRN